ncbi:hypothetical protein R3P38DRAFT_2793021 [Favolaschia claudopus]|uniref:Uncharacterized protein n=1 Tax=Favolaschia claudopus TaxID=2862362 RepID=A0AAW0AD83_9AGAR
MANKPSQAAAPAKTAGKSARNRVAPKKLLDGLNSEAPSAAHQAIVDQTQARLDAATAIARLIKNIEDLDPLLPDSVAEGTEDDRIYHVITTIQGLDPESVSSTFTRRFDILFKEDAQCRDENGRLHLIRRGELGMLIVARYLREIKWGVPDMNSSLEGAVLKLERVVKEMETLSGVDRSEAKTAGKAAVSKPKPAVRKDTAASAGPSSEPADAFERLFQATLSGKKKRADKDYKPKKNLPQLSEEEDDDFMDIDEEEPAANSSGPKKKKRKSKSTAASAPPPEVEVIEVNDESEDEVRTAGKRGPTTDTRLHYFSPTAVTLQGKKRWSFKCRHDGCQKVVTFERTVEKDQSFGEERPAPKLGNLATHLREKHEGEPVPSQPEPGVFHNVSASSAKIMADYLAEGKLNPVINSTQKNFLKIVSAWIVEDNLPFTTGETPGIQRLFAFLQSRYLLPSDTTEVKSKIAVATDTWTTRAMTFTFAGTIGLWISSEWELVERVLDFHPIEDKEHEGEYAALGLAKQLNALEALEKISFLHLIAIALDNASPNTVLVTSLSRLLMKKFDIQFVPANSQIHCLAHVVNLVVQKILAALDAAPDPDADGATDATDEYLNNKDLPFHYDPHLDPEQIRLEEEVFTKEDEEGDEEDEAAELLAGILDDEYAEMSPLQKLRTATTKICSSPQRRKRFRATAERIYGDEKAPSGRLLASLMVVRDVRHRWNNTHAMIKRGLMLRKSVVVKYSSRLSIPGSLSARN